MWYAVWHGGHSYSMLDPEEFVETFDTLDDAKEEFRTRYYSGRFNTFRYVNQEPNTLDTPGVDETAIMDLWSSDPTGGDFYPERRMEFGPRLGVRVFPC